LVSDQPSWGRRNLTHDLDASTSLVSDQPSWGRRNGDGLEVTGLSVVSDQPSWGRRTLYSSSSPSFWESFRPTLVGSEVEHHASVVRYRLVSDQPSWGRRNRLDSNDDGKVGFRPTLVGSEGWSGLPRLQQLLGFQTNPRGVGGDVGHLVDGCFDMFQTNPRGVGGATRLRPSGATVFQTNPRGVGGQPSVGP